VWDEPKGQDSLGLNPLQRVYQVSDAWIFLGLRPEEVARLNSIEGLEGLGGLSDDELERGLEERFRLADARTWVERLSAANIGAHRVTSLAEIMDDPWVRSHQLIVTREHEGLGPVDQVGAIPRLSRTPTMTGSPATEPGARGREVLDELGLGDELDQLIKVGAVSIP
jgi:crotonobetainyl-CoA:carnitine CoA-transferase CaiB-like acyl-CoA transferase